MRKVIALSLQLPLVLLAACSADMGGKGEVEPMLLLSVSVDKNKFTDVKVLGRFERKDLRGIQTPSVNDGPFAFDIADGDGVAMGHGAFADLRGALANGQMITRDRGSLLIAIPAPAPSATGSMNLFLKGPNGAMVTQEQYAVDQLTMEATPPAGAAAGQVAGSSQAQNFVGDVKDKVVYAIINEANADAASIEKLKTSIQSGLGDLATLFTFADYTGTAGDAQSIRVEVATNLFGDAAKAGRVRILRVKDAAAASASYDEELVIPPSKLSMPAGEAASYLLAEFIGFANDTGSATVNRNGPNVAMSSNPHWICWQQQRVGGNLLTAIQEADSNAKICPGANIMTVRSLGGGAFAICGQPLWGRDDLASYIPVAVPIQQRWRDLTQAPIEVKLDGQPQAVVDSVNRVLACPYLPGYFCGGNLNSNPAENESAQVFCGAAEGGTTPEPMPVTCPSTCTNGCVAGTATCNPPPAPCGGQTCTYGCDMASNQCNCAGLMCNNGCNAATDQCNPPPVQAECGGATCTYGCNTTTDQCNCAGLTCTNGCNTQTNQCNPPPAPTCGPGNGCPAGCTAANDPDCSAPNPTCGPGNGCPAGCTTANDPECLPAGSCTNNTHACKANGGSSCRPDDGLPASWQGDNAGEAQTCLPSCGHAILVAHGTYDPTKAKTTLTNGSCGAGWYRWKAYDVPACCIQGVQPPPGLTY